ncbi:tonB dependent receptor family protein [Asticcacaulis biprosthecium C19]|uniref:TonB dependent receptor family protein n=1 Tax=Asticcacaulis biprosthecium C19 TaxID=715226 RepID=F4QLI2_9CAUL|nr:tonB dependent receptor family protein [Asticcacaulis biprosthecium C19]
MATTALAFALPALPAFAADAPADTAAEAQIVDSGDTVIVSARRRSEDVQTVPVAISVVGGQLLDKAGINNFEQLQRYQPTVQLITQNPRNTATTIRGLGSTIGLTNDGLEQGVGIYVDEVFYARPGSALIDLVDIERIEVLRGPQGTLFGKNTTAGAIHVITRAPTFKPEANLEVSLGDKGFLQTKAVINGPLIDGTVAGRLVFGSTRRDGVLYNVTTKTKQNDLNSHILRGQLLFTPSENLSVKIAADYALTDPEGFAQGFVRFGPTLRNANRQFPYLAAQAGYAPASQNVYDRLVDVDGELQAKQRVKGVSATVNWDLGWADFTSITAHRAWNWWPQNDRDYTSLKIRTKSSNNSEQRQISQEFRLASNDVGNIDWVVGVYAFSQRVETNGTEAWGADAARWLIGNTTGTPAVAVPADLLDGYQQEILAVGKTDSLAAFGQLTWQATEKLSLTAGLRYTTEKKTQLYDQVASGGLATTTPQLIAAKNGISRTYTYTAELEDSKPSGLLSLSYKLTPSINTYASYSKGFKSGGINAAGIPTDTAGAPILKSAVLRPEEVDAFEIGLKSQLFDRRATVNVAAFTTSIKDYQANVVDSGLGSIRGYLANVEKVEVNGVELDTRFRITDNLSVYGAVAYTDAKYASFKNAPAPLELQASGNSVVDLSGVDLPGVSKWGGAFGFDYSIDAPFNGIDGQAYLSGDANYRSDWNSDASVSKYAVIEASTIANFRFGYRTPNGLDTYFWVKNAFDEEYLTILTIQQGNSGAIYGQPGDPRTFGVTIRKAF